MDKSKTKKQLLQEIEELRTRLEEAEETLRAIRSGEVDALVVDGARGSQVYTLQGADRSYRVLLETMEEGAGTLGMDGTVIYCNQRLAEMLRTPLEKVMGTSLRNFLSPEDWRILKEMGEGGKRDGLRAEVRFNTGDGSRLSALVSLGSMEVGDFQGICFTAADLTQQKQTEEALLRSRNELEKRVQERTEDLTRTNRMLLSEIHKRNQAVEALRRSEERLALAASGTGIGFFEWDIARGRVLWSRQHDIIFGYRGEDTTTTTTAYDYRHWADRVHPEDLPRVEEEAHRCLEECKPFDFQYRIVWPDGSVHWVQSKGVFACDGQGQAVQMMGIAQDITERKRTEEALAAASERMFWVARFPEENPNPVMRAAADGTILYCNPAAKKIAGWGYEEGQLLADPLLKAVTMAMASGAEAEEDLDLGDRAYTVFVVPVLREGYANIYGWDITRRKQAEERIFEANQRMDALLKALPVGVSFSDDPECKRVTGNLALLSQFEISTQDNLSASTPDLQAAGRKVRYFRGGREMADFELPLQRAVAENREISPMEIEVRLASGRRWITEASAAPFFDQAGNILGGVCVTLDITERKRFEKELQESKQHLETLLENLPIGVWFTDETGKILYGNAAGREIWRGVRHVGPEEYHEFKAWWADTGIPLGPDDWAVTRAVRKGEISLNETLKIECFDGSQKIIRNSAVPLRTNGDRLFGVVVLNEDITERVRMEEEIRRSEALFKLLSKTAGRLLQTENPQAAVEELCREVMAHLDCQVFFNFLASEGTGRLHLNAYAGIPEEEARKIEWLDYGVAVCGCVARDGLPILADDIFNIPDPRTDLVKSYGVQAYACHPLKIGDRLIGTLSFGTKTRTRFSAEDVALMRTVTDQVSAAMEKIRLVQELQKSRDELEKRVQERTEELTQSQKRLQQLASQLLRAQEGERKRVAVELHDGLLSELAATKFLLEGKVMLLERGLPVDPGDLRRVADILGGAMKEARRLMNNLHPSILDELGLIATIGWLCGEYQKAYPHIAVRKEIAVSERDIAAEVRVVVYRVLQEALNNFARHGKGDRIEISLAKSEGGFCFEIRDNGQGFDVDTAQRGLGLESMRERVEVLGGEFRIKSAIGQGTSIRAIWTCL